MILFEMNGTPAESFQQRSVQRSVKQSNSCIINIFISSRVETGADILLYGGFYGKVTVETPNIFGLLGRFPQHYLHKNGFIVFSIYVIFQSII